MLCSMARGLSGARIRKRRQALNLTQQELADKVGVHVSAVVSWENGTHEPRRYLGKIEEVLGVSIAEQKPESLPAIVGDNYGDEAVRIIWGRERISRDARLGLIAWYVALRDEADKSA